MARSRTRTFLLKPMLQSYASILVPILISNILKHPLLWKFVGVASSTIGLLCYALSSSFQFLFGKWNLLKLILYCVVSLIISCIMIFPEKLQLSWIFRLKSHVVFLVLILTSLYSFFYDKAVNGKPDVYSLISNGAFALMSLSLSRQIQLGFESGLSNFFLGCFVAQLIKINLIITSVAAVFCYSLIAFRSYMDLKSKIGHVSEDDQLTIEIGTINEASFDNLASTEMVDIGSTSRASSDNLESIEMVPIQKEARGANKLRRRSIVKAEHTSSSRSLQPKRVVGWTEEEHKLFLLGLDKYGKGEWKRISREFVKTRTPAEVANHALKDFIRTANANRKRRKSNQVDISMDLTAEEKILDQTETSEARVSKLRSLKILPPPLIYTSSKLKDDVSHEEGDEKVEVKAVVKREKTTECEVNRIGEILLTPSSWTGLWDTDAEIIFSVPPLSPLSPHPPSSWTGLWDNDAGIFSVPPLSPLSPHPPSSWTGFWDNDVKIFSVPPLSPLSPHPPLD